MGSRNTSRTYPLLELARGRANKNVRARAAALMHHALMWNDVLTAKEKTVENRSLSFRLLSRAECIFEAKTGGPQKRAPFMTFLILGGGDSVLCIAQCRLDECSKAIVVVAATLENGIHHPDCQADVRVVAMLAKSSNGRVEKGHAALNRHIRARVHILMR